MPQVNTVDVLVVGAGPAGASCARLLRHRQHSVLLLEGPHWRHHIVETLPASAHELLDLSGAVSFPESGSTIWWGSPEPEITTYAGPNFARHIERAELDRVLLEGARSAGVHVLHNRHAPTFELTSGAVTHDHGTTIARFIVDATGRSGLLVRQIRRFWDERHVTIGVCRILRNGEMEGVDPNHTLVEAFETGWGWSVPFAGGFRYVCFMLDAADARTGAQGAYECALEGATQFNRLFRNAEPQGPVFGRDASLYHAERYAGRNWILIGDAGSFADPVASFGLEKALRSARAAAETVHTCLADPASADAAADRYDADERRLYFDLQNEAKRRFARAADYLDTPFWQVRASA